VLVIGVAEDDVPVAIFETSVVPLDCISSITIQYLRSPVPDVLCANKLLAHNPGIIVTVLNVVAGLTNCTIFTSPSAGSKFDVEITV